MKKYYREIILVIIILGFIFYKIPHLSLPYYGDEGFAFGPAVKKMYQDGLGILPSALPPEYSYGHPLLFHFCAAGWMHLVGDTQAGTKSFALFLAISLLISIYFIVKDLYNADAGLLAAIIIMLQPVFIAQSGFLLLEIMVTLLGMWTIYFWFKRKYLLYAVFASALVMTKESGLFLIFALGVWQLIDFFIIKTERFSFGLFLKKFLIMAAPAYVFGAFLLIQKETWGWYFYPLRIQDMNTEIDKINHLSWWTRQIIFTLHGRHWVSLAAAAGTLLYFILPGRRFEPRQWNYLIFLLLFIFVFKYISILNFISNRYFLITNAALIIISAVMVVQALKKFKWLMYPLSLLLIYSQIAFAGERNSPGDDCLGSIDNIVVQQQAVKYLEDMDLYDERIYSHFLMRENLYRPSIGYLSGNRIFTNVAKDFNNHVKYAVISGLEHWETDSVRKLPQLRLMKRFEQHNAWVEVYENDSLIVNREPLQEIENEK